MESKALGLLRQVQGELRAWERGCGGALLPRPPLAPPRRRRAPPAQEPRDRRHGALQLPLGPGGTQGATYLSLSAIEEGLSGRMMIMMVCFSTPIRWTPIE